MNTVLVRLLWDVVEVDVNVLKYHTPPVREIHGEGARVRERDIAKQDLLHAVHREPRRPPVFRRRVLLVLRVAVIRTAEEGDVAIRAALRLRRRIGNEWAIGVVREIEPARAVQALDGRVGVNFESGNKDRPIHNKFQRTEFRRPV